MPQEKAVATGAAVKNPAMFKDRNPPKVAPLGKAPSYLSESEREVWDEIAGDVPWLKKSDRLVLESACRLVVRMRAEPDFPISGYGELRNLLSRMGATPSDRTRISAPPDEPDDPADKFFN